jgi:hypothetical protein
MQNSAALAFDSMAIVRALLRAKSIALLQAGRAATLVDK